MRFPLYAVLSGSLCCLMISGCATSRSAHKTAAATAFSQPAQAMQTVLETIPATGKPGWTAAPQETWVEANTFYAIGREERGNDLEKSIASAESAAIASMSPLFKKTLADQFNAIIAEKRYKPETKQAVIDAFAARINDLSLPAQFIKESYSEKVREISDQGGVVFYRSLVLVTLQKSDYQKSALDLMKAIRADLKGKVAPRRLVRSIEKTLMQDAGK